MVGEYRHGVRAQSSVLQQQATENDRLFQMLAEQQKDVLAQVLAEQVTANQQVWDHVAQSLAVQRLAEQPKETTLGTMTTPQPLIKVQKMTPDDNLDTFVNAFERTAIAAIWPKAQWATVLIQYLIRPAQQAVGTLPAADLRS